MSRGYFGLGLEGLSKPHNAGALMRTAHAFGASFIVAIGSSVNWRHVQQADTSHTADQLPVYVHERWEDFTPPRKLRTVGIELIEGSQNLLDDFRHPPFALYILGPERGSLSPATVARCDAVVHIPTQFCVNVSIAGAIVMYDRMRTVGTWHSAE